MLVESSHVLILIIIFMMSEMYSALVIKISNYKIIAYLQSVSLILKVIVSTGNMTQVHVTLWRCL